VKRTEHLLVILMEECAEVAQRASKALRFGLKEVEPGQEATNAERLAGELADLDAVVLMCEAEGAFACAGEQSALERKERKVERFLAYSAECGTLTAPPVEAPEEET
jgi:NTP pyrophosphatase (non-canonical NTP hydrolase)